LPRGSAAGIPGLSKGHIRPLPTVTFYVGGSLSKGHIRPLPTVTFYVGGSLLRFDSRLPVDPVDVQAGGADQPKRAEIVAFSEKSRQRLRLSLAKVDQSKCGRPIFGTLTYPKEFPLDGETFKRHLKIFSQRFLRAFPSAGFHWKLEFQERGAPHFHPIFWNLDSECLDRFRIWLALDWFEVVASGDGKHLVAGTSADLINSQFGIMRYVSGYVSDADQTKPGFKVGRYWGIVGRKNIPWAKGDTIELSHKQGKFVRRTARRYMQSVNRERRIRHVEKLLPWQMCAAAMLNGEIRRLRKESPHLKVFEHFPRKLRLKNNRNINLFCKAGFWRDAIVKRMLSE
jgi:hypothetical protein